MFLMTHVDVPTTPGILDASPALCCPSLLDAPLGEEEAHQLASVLKALADPARLRVLSVLAAAEGGEVCACDLPGLVGRSQPTVSHHLAKLVEVGLVEREQRGKWAWFRLRRDSLDAVCASLVQPREVEVRPLGG